MHRCRDKMTDKPRQSLIRGLALQNSPLRAFHVELYGFYRRQKTVYRDNGSLNNTPASNQLANLGHPVLCFVPCCVLTFLAYAGIATLIRGLEKILDRLLLTASVAGFHGFPLRPQ